MPWSSVIQKSTQSTLSKRMICLVKMVLSAKKTADDERGDMARARAARARAGRR